MNILLYAFIENNLGDDLFIKIICERYPDVNFFLPISKTKTNKSLSQLKNLHFSDELSRIYQKLKKESIINNHLKLNFTILSKHEKKLLKFYDASVYIVGSAFIQRGKNKDYSNLILLNKMVYYSNNFFLINANFGPYEDKKYLLKSREIIFKMNDACFRDEYSYNLFNKLNNVRMASDVVLMINDKATTSDSIIISIMDLNDDYIEFIKKCIKKIKDIGFIPYIVTFCKNQNDEIAAEKIKDVNIIKYNDNIESILNLFKNAKAIIATRFHSMILAFAYNKNVLPIIYNPKIKKVLDDCKFEGNYIELNKINTYDIDKIINELINSQLKINDEYKQKAEKQFKALDEYLKGNKKYA